jgi:hypothetical protein
MWMQPLGGGWNVMGMAQVIPVVTAGAPGQSASPLSRTNFYATQPAAMINLESPGSRWVFRFTPNFEGLTIPDGESTFGGWGEGFIDSRHPHTLLHEMMLSFNVWNPDGVSGSISAGKGFAPYGTDDPMARPVLKYPTNHHLSRSWSAGRSMGSCCGATGAWKGGSSAGPSRRIHTTSPTSRASRTHGPLASRGGGAPGSGRSRSGRSPRRTGSCRRRRTAVTAVTAVTCTAATATLTEGTTTWRRREPTS